MARFCAWCGEQLNDGAVFCRACGKRIDGTSDAAIPPQQTRQTVPPPAAAPAPSNTSGRKGGLIGIIAAAVVVAAVLLTGFVWPGFFRGSDRESGPETNTGPVEITVPQDMIAPAATPAPTVPVQAVEITSFSDVHEGDWYYDAAAWAAGNGLVSGETFAPNDTATRAQALTFLWRAKGKPAPAPGFVPFSDVSSDSYYYEPVLWAFEQGLVSENADRLFRPDDAVTRAQTATFLYRAENGSGDALTNPFGDVSDGDWYAPAAKWAYSRGIVGPGSFDPEGNCTRAVYITFLYRCYGGPDSVLTRP